MFLLTLWKWQAQLFRAEPAGPYDLLVGTFAVPVLPAGLFVLEHDPTSQRTRTTKTTVGHHGSLSCLALGPHTSIFRSYSVMAGLSTPKNCSAE